MSVRSRCSLYATPSSPASDPLWLRSRNTYYGIRVSPGAGSLLKQLLFGFVSLALVIVAFLRSGNLLHKVAID